tara:strand:- start:171 stop:335 length:165 start_codon:yes stop_codon:yes gene_type:complete
MPVQLLLSIMVMSVVMVAVVLVLLDRNRRTITAIEGQVLSGMAAQGRITALLEV